ncbi:hypothetical protein E3N88_19746 [Mikania micrantha]|uniref:Chromo domain-containing protein n=1 Tax=Mikania micrantha TaxID=192012 RepID=A0A5N6NQR6_9ASTR|nr:hypothetical protein E3N88_19746 [Mikania micrantha]
MARNRMKQYADVGCTDRVFEPGNWVYLKLRPFVQTTLKSRKDSKLIPKYFGPFLILQKVGKVAYKLDLPSEAQIHPVFHVSLLKLAHGPHQPLVPLPSNPRFSLKPRSIIDRRVVRRGQRMVTQVLVNWQNLSVADATWEYLDDFVLRFPEFET